MSSGRRGAHAAPRTRSGVPAGRVLLAVVLILGCVVAAVAWVVTSDVDLPALPGTRPLAASSTSASPGAGPTVPVAERFTALGTDPTAGSEKCHDVDVEQQDAAITERVTCKVKGGRVELTTYASTKALASVREGVLDPRVGSLMSTRQAGSWYSLDPALAQGSPKATIYWDDLAALQSARFTGGASTSLRSLARLVRSTEPSVTAPTGPVDDELAEFAAIYLLTDCARVPVRLDGESEESKCTFKSATARAAAFADRASLRAFREQVAGLAADDETGLDDFWYHDTNGEDGHQDDEPEEGKVYGYTDGERSVLYVDDTSCRCYLQIFDGSGIDPRELYEKVF